MKLLTLYKTVKPSLRQSLIKMKENLFLIFLILNVQLIFGQIFNIETIKDSGNINKGINLVILSEGYQTTELAQFIADATTFSNEMFSQSPFLEYCQLLQCLCYKSTF